MYVPINAHNNDGVASCEICVKYITSKGRVKRSRETTKPYRFYVDDDKAGMGWENDVKASAFMLGVSFRI